MSGRADSSPGIRVPELGPSLGHMVVPSAGVPGSPSPVPRSPFPRPELDDIRYDLVTAIFELAGEAREWSAGADRDLALSALNRAAWLHAWERAVAAAAERVAAAIDAALQGAARESRMPTRRARRLVLGPIERRAIAGRLGAGGGPLLASLDLLEETIPSLRTAASLDPAAHEAWHRGLTTAARRLEAAWLALDDATGRERQRWSREVEAVRCWRRPLWPVWVVAAVLFGLATWLGLVIGGYLPAPSFFQGWVAAWWQRFSW